NRPTERRRCLRCRRVAPRYRAKFRSRRWRTMRRAFPSWRRDNRDAGGPLASPNFSGALQSSYEPSRSSGHVALAYVHDHALLLGIELDDRARLLTGAIVPAEQPPDLAGFDQPPHDRRAAGLARGLDQRIASRDHVLADPRREQQRWRIDREPAG